MWSKDNPKLAKRKCVCDQIQKKEDTNFPVLFSIEYLLASFFKIFLFITVTVRAPVLSSLSARVKRIGFWIVLLRDVAQISSIETHLDNKLIRDLWFQESAAQIGFIEDINFLIAMKLNKIDS